MLQNFKYFVTFLLYKKYIIKQEICGKEQKCNITGEKSEEQK